MDFQTKLKFFFGREPLKPENFVLQKKLFLIRNSKQPINLYLFRIIQSKSKPQKQEVCMISLIALLLTLIGHNMVYIRYIISLYQYMPFIACHIKFTIVYYGKNIGCCIFRPAFDPKS